MKRFVLKTLNEYGADVTLEGIQWGDGSSTVRFGHALNLSVGAEAWDLMLTKMFEGYTMTWLDV